MFLGITMGVAMKYPAEEQNMDTALLRQKGIIAAAY